MKSGRIVAFDIEIAKIFPDDEEDWSKHRPFGISCAATLVVDPGKEPVLKHWHAGRDVDWAPFEMIPSQMDEEDCAVLAFYLAGMVDRDYDIVTWNGLGFDFDVLAEESSESMRGLIEQLAVGHIDMGWQMFCERGFLCGLDAAAKGLKLGGKTEGMSGAMAPKMWAESRESQDKVLEYVAQDVRTTAAVYEKLMEMGNVAWITGRGTPARNPWAPAFPGGKMMTAEQAALLPLPNTKWMGDGAWPRSKFSGWLSEEAKC